jgi:hypothetical protein
MTVRDVRKEASSLGGGWTAVELCEGYALRCGDIELCTVNGREPRVFRTLDALKRTLKEEIGITEFKVEVKS